MSFDIAFYDAVVDMKKAAAAAAQGGDHGAEQASAGEDVFTLLGDWQEDTLDIQAFLQARSVDAAVPAPAPQATAAGAASGGGGGGVGRLPTPVIVRPSNLNLTQGGLYNGSQAPSHQQQQQQHMSASSRGGQVSPHGSVHQVPEMPQVSPQHSPYGQSGTMFDYGGVSAASAKQQQQQQQQQQQHRAAAAMMAAVAQSPRTPVFGSYSAAVSAAAAPGMLGGGGGGMHSVVKHDEDSCSSSLDSYQGPSSGMHGGVGGSAGSASRKRSSTASVSSSERDPDAYRAKRERNNVAVRKSREKKKQREQETEKRVKELSDENASLVGKVELLTKQLATIKSLFAVLTKSLPPEHRRRAELELDSLNVGRFYEQPTTPPPAPRGGN